MIIAQNFGTDNIFLRSVFMILDEIKEILAENLDINTKDIDISSNLSDDLGADSLDAIDIVMSIEDKYSIEVPDEAIEKMKTVADIVEFVEARA